ncbi:cilia- and flagella-associated protein 68-like [Patella vulgata]|uniref:cilia- and flagella-associated protein 68-like n=1 Tax=Patella vulgata TaxID=6465 RepID=UPI0024A9A932|nr:cilia- and flagella-associated protein 68-like [Patella vulgata]
MSLQPEPSFRSMVRSSGLAEEWVHENDNSKFGQVGWRCTTKEDAYSNTTLIGNWNEKRFDISRIKNKPLPSQYNHYFESTYDASHNVAPNQMPRELKHLKARHPHAFPSHQPELDHHSLKSQYNSWETTSRGSYVSPKVRQQPVSTIVPDTQTS